MLDDLLTWCSERVSGTYGSFQDTYEWLAAGQKGMRPLHWKIILRNMQTLGHIEADDDRQQWSVTPAVMSVLADGAGYALLIGQRPIFMLQRLFGLADEKNLCMRRLASSLVALPPILQRGGPSVQLLAMHSEESAREVCSTLGIRFEHHAAEQLAQILPNLPDLLRGRAVLRGPAGVEPHKLSLSEIPEWIPANGAEPRGGYQYQRYRGHQYVYWIQGQGFVSDKRSVMYAEIARRRQQILHYHHERRELYVPSRVQLPWLHARAAVLRSGFLPQLAWLPDGLPGGSGNGSHRDYVKYININYDFAETIARSLKQELDVRV
ncbi:hypothetical protein ACIBG8_45240 [Nonomuraea sp. NPDC050556]|uniref:hypothetical protein n=1 Tax=Nonomuraea sp. NPDC050556 TaxID=3364369 RepID=UPI00378FA7AD